MVPVEIIIPIVFAWKMENVSKIFPKSFISETLVDPDTSHQIDRS